MTELHLFSQVCPEFSVFDLQIYQKNFGNQILASKLTEMGKVFCSRWLSHNQKKWESRIKDHLIEINEKDVQWIYWGQTQYPEKLKYLAKPPAILTVRGNLDCFRRPCLGVVGAREPTDFGVHWLTKNLPAILSDYDLSVVSGGARGIDREAHLQCMFLGRRTISVLPGGILDPYPKSHRGLFEKIEESGGVVVSELPLHAQIERNSFQRRNRLIVGLSDLLLILEAGLRSGTMVSARSAICENKELMVLPGPPVLANYEGSLELIAQGASPLRDFNDVVNYFAEKKYFEK